MRLRRGSSSCCPISQSKIALPDGELQQSAAEDAQRAGERESIGLNSFGSCRFDGQQLCDGVPPRPCAEFLNVGQRGETSRTRRRSATKAGRQPFLTPPAWLRWRGFCLSGTRTCSSRFMTRSRSRLIYSARFPNRNRTDSLPLLE